jgi:DDE superfamily endonuclease
VWALPFLTVLAPSERYNQSRGYRHKKLTDWARQMLYQVRRWLPQQSIVVVADSSFAALELLWAVSQMQVPIHIVTRLRLDAALYQPAPPRQPKQMGRPRKVGKRLPTLKTLLSDSRAYPTNI